MQTFPGNDLAKYLVACQNGASWCGEAADRVEAQERAIDWWESSGIQHDDIVRIRRVAGGGG